MIRLSQEWLDRVSEEPEDLIVSGPLSPMNESILANEDILKPFVESAAAKEIIRREWVSSADNGAVKSKNVITDLIKSILMIRPDLSLDSVMCRGSSRLAAQKFVNQLSSYTWLIHVIDIAKRQNLPAFSFDNISDNKLRQLAAFSVESDGPARVKNWMLENGIHFVIESSLPGMKLDGIAAMLSTNRPIIALTLRYDRLDSFWFTLFHELGHIKKHLSKSEESIFIDDFDEHGYIDEAEAEADAFARDTLIPRNIWRRSDAYRFGTKEAIRALAEQLNINPAIIAGRLRYETKNYTLFPEMLGQDKVRDMLID